MIAHVVLFRPRMDLDSATRRALGQAFSSVIKDIGSIRRAQIGRRRTHGRAYEQLMHENYTHAAILEFDDLAGLKFYLEHPAHEMLGAQFFACFEHVLIYDFEMNEGENGVAALMQDARA